MPTRQVVCFTGGDTHREEHPMWQAVVLQDGKQMRDLADVQAALKAVWPELDVLPAEPAFDDDPRCGVWMVEVPNQVDEYLESFLTGESHEAEFGGTWTSTDGRFAVEIDLP